MTSSKLDSIILGSLLSDETYARKVLPFLNEIYFQDPVDRCLFSAISGSWEKIGTKPPKDVVDVELSNHGLGNDHDAKLRFEAKNRLSSLPDHLDIPREWLMQNTETFCRSQAVFNAIMRSIQIYDGRDKELTIGSIPDLMTKALSVSLDVKLGHDFWEDAEDRFNWYHASTTRIPWALDIFNKVTHGGIIPGSLNVVMAGVGIGKSLFMTSMMAGWVSQGRKVLYLTMEMADMQIAERVDANLLDVDMNELRNLSHDSWRTRLDAARRGSGDIKIAKFPMAGTTVQHLKRTVDDLRLKKNWVPDVIVVDYLNLLTSYRVKVVSSKESYINGRYVAEELKTMAEEYSVPILTANQLNRTGYGSSDPGLDDTGESFGIPHAADFFFSLVMTDQMRELGQYLVKQQKNRYGDDNENRWFVIGVDKKKMRLYDINQSDFQIQTSKSAGKDGKKSVKVEKKEDDKPAFDSTPFGRRVGSEKREPHAFDDVNF